MTGPEPDTPATLTVTQKRRLNGILTLLDGDWRVETVRYGSNLHPVAHATDGVRRLRFTFSSLGLIRIWGNDMELRHIQRMSATRIAQRVNRLLSE
ncbi:hypothetical protein [Bifidobacterium felsineum]|uniref:hypothetical protein n=1 Tax=Bifidobacterium felsineum TaxID=2045440 RepID=UPI001BDBFA9B|nr:hypothetical protein [Bifidobacterium felsineum]MBT1164604.1 hypothetical protein [Bifidobacterium felsineum]